MVDNEAKNLAHVDFLIEAVQGKGPEENNMPEEVYEQIVAEIRNNNMELGKVTREDVRKIFRKLRLQRYLDNFETVFDRIKNQPPIQPPQLPDYMVKEIRNMYSQYYIFYKNTCATPDGRIRSPLSHYYCLKKIIEILEHRNGEPPRFDNLISYLRSREKLRNQDRTWKLVCDALNWEFIESIPPGE
jgi:hypothetical protein